MVQLCDNGDLQSAIHVGGGEMQDISNQAFAAFERESQANFITKACLALRSAIPSLADEPEPAFRQHVVSLVGQARGYGLKSNEEIAIYLTTAGLMGVDFVDRFRGARDILEGRENGGRKAELLESLTLAILEALEQ